MNEKIISTNNVSICTESFGKIENPAILLIMGATASMLWWDKDFCQRLAEKGFFVIRYDNRDTGKSTNYELGITPYSLDDLVDDAIGILDSYKISKANLVGMSLGGTLAQIAALKYPDRVNSLTLMSTGPWADSDPNIPEMDKRIIEYQAKSKDIDWKNEKEVIEYLIESWEIQSGSGRKFDKDKNRKLAREEFERANNYTSMFNHAGLDGAQQYYNHIDEITQKTLIIHGTEDNVINYQHSKVLKDKIKNSKLVTLEGAGHEIHPDDWQVIIDSITKHILE